MSYPSCSSKRTTVSSPGKVLLAGGYLVLDPAHSGLVISTSSRFYTSISSSLASPPPGNIVVRSPQFTNATWTYSLSRVKENGEGGKNKFVRIALEKTFRLAGEMVGAGEVEAMIQGGLEAVIVGDNDFYSQRKQVSLPGFNEPLDLLPSFSAQTEAWDRDRWSALYTVITSLSFDCYLCTIKPQLETLSLPLSLSSLEHLPPFSPTNDTLANVHKTGLGSSAALITSLCAALLLHLGAVSPQAFSSASSVPSPSPPSLATTSSSKLSPSDELKLIHNIAQYTHCLAQGKVGSGFDVSSAVFGSQIYHKFSPDALKGLMTAAEEDVSTAPPLSALNPFPTSTKASQKS
jgi:phosphomevalonate kinase